MAKEVFGDYAAFTSRGGVRFSYKGKMIGKDAVPPEVVSYLEDKLRNPPKPELSVAEPKFPRPTPEQIAQMKAESLQVPDHLKISPEEELVRNLTGVPDNEAPLVPDSEPLTPDDFDEPEESPAPLTDLAPGVASQVDPSFMETVSIHTAKLEDIAQALLDRFGIYTVYLGGLPKPDEINPLTGEPFTKYHLGIAYQAALFAQSQGLRAPETHRKAIDQGRAASENFQDQFVPVARTLGEARAQDSFAFRTSVRGTQDVSATQIVHVTDENGQVHAVQKEVQLSEHGGTAHSRYDEDEDEQVIEPPIFGTKPIIKPNW